MKYTFVLLLMVGLVSESTAQISYESPHVKNGKTFRGEIPEGFFLIGELNNSGEQEFSTDENLDFENADLDTLKTNIISVFHAPVGDFTLESLQEIMSQQLEGGEGIIVARQPEIDLINDRSFLMTAYLGGITEGRSQLFFTGITRFGDYFVNIIYFSTKRANERMSAQEFRAFLETWEEIATNKENAIDEEGSFSEEESIDEE